MRIKSLQAFVMGLCVAFALDAAVNNCPWLVLLQSGLFVLNAWIGHECKDSQ